MICSSKGPEDLEAVLTWQRLQPGVGMMPAPVFITCQEAEILRHQAEYKAKKESHSNALLVTEEAGVNSECAGKYIMVTCQGPGECPLWQHSKWPLWIYKGTDGSWYIGNEDDRDNNFDCAQGFIRSQVASFEQWERYDDDRAAWLPVAITVVGEE